MKPEHYYAKLGAEIKRQRRALGMSQRDLAKETRVTQPQIARIEAGQQGVRFIVLLRISRALEVRPSDLLGLAGM